MSASSPVSESPVPHSSSVACLTSVPHSGLLTARCKVYFSQARWSVHTDDHAFVLRHNILFIWTIFSKHYHPCDLCVCMHLCVLEYVSGVWGDVCTYVAVSAEAEGCCHIFLDHSLLSFTEARSLVEPRAD